MRTLIETAALFVGLCALVALCGCDSAAIDSCRYGCAQQGGRMMYYSPRDGCGCEYPTPGATP